MKVIRFKESKYQPASHENPQNPGVLKKIIFTKDNFKIGRVQMINWAKLPPKKSFRKHYHEDMEEIFIIIKGKVKIKVGKETAQLQAGDAILVPKNQVHLMKNLTNQPVHYLVVGISGNKNGQTVVV